MSSSSQNVVQEPMLMLLSSKAMLYAASMIEELRRAQSLSHIGICSLC